MSAARGKFITLEGMDGAGKSSHVGWIAEFLRGRGKTVTVTREPGGTPLGEKLRELMLDRSQNLHPETEALLMFAARREHIAVVIEPALASGSWVLCDRFTDASYAYQSGGSGLAWEKIAQLEAWVQGGMQPDLTLYFDVPTEVGRARTGSVREPDRFEREQADFFNRVREGYLRRVQENPQRVVKIDASGSLDNVAKLVDEIIINYCK